MRLILCHRSLDLPKRAQLPDGTFAFLCFEDFSVGPLGDWRNPSEFKKSREAFARKSPHSVLPDGSLMHYFVWLQTRPKYDLVEMHKQGVEIDDIPLPLEFENVAPVATEIEIWRDQSVNGVVFQWYLSWVLPAMGVDLENVSVCVLPHPLTDKLTEEFWIEMLYDMPERKIPAVAPSLADWQNMLRCWEGVANLPEPINSSLIEKSDKHALQAFAIMKGRQADVVTGLTNLQTRILRATSVDWTKMARTIAEAMIAGQDVDDYLWGETIEVELNEMTKMPSPLIEKSGIGPMHKCEIRLTPHGVRKRMLLVENR